MRDAAAIAKPLSVIGVGPGDGELLTVKAIRRIEAGELIFAPRASIGEDSLALEICKPYITDGQQIEFLTYPMSRDREMLTQFWGCAAEKVTNAVKKNKRRSVFLTLGDPSVYSTWSYLKQGLLDRQWSPTDWEIVPGITSFSHGAALLSEELCIGEAPFCVIPPPADREALRACLERFPTVVLMKVGRQWPKLREWLKELAVEDSAYLVSRAGLEGQLLKPLSEVAPGQEGYLSLAIVKTQRREMS